MKLTIRGHPRDIVQVMVNGVQVSYNITKKSKSSQELKWLWTLAK